jgi:hypothetical protein
VADVPWTGGSDFDVLRDVVGRLERAGIDYVLTGSTVMSYCAAPRDTRDFDIVAEIEPRLIDAVTVLFADFGLAQGVVRDAILHRGSFNLIHPETITKIDILLPKHREFHASTMARRTRTEVYPGTTLWISTCEDLVLSKLLFSIEPPNSRDQPSPYQLRDVAAILDARPIDAAYVERWVGRLGLDSVWQRKTEPT